MRNLIVLLMAMTLLALAFTPVVGTQDEALKIINDHDCAECHNISAVGIGELPAAEPEGDDDGWGDDDWGDGEEVGPPDLSSVGTVADAEWLGQWLLKKVSVEGRKHPERFDGSKEDLQTLTMWLSTLKYDLPEGVGAAAHVQEKKKDKKNEK